MLKSSNKLHVTIGIYTLLLFITIVLLFPVIFSKAGSFCIIGDNLHLSYPFLNKLSIALHKGYLPVWDANTFGGKNFPGELQSGTFYPFNILWCFLFGTMKGIDVYYIDLLVALHYFICLTGMYKLSRVFRMPPGAAIGAALVFTFTGVLSARSGCEVFIFYGLTLLPWAIFFLGKYYWERQRKRYLVFAGLVGGLQILAGHIQPFFHTLFIAVILVVFYEYWQRKSWKTFFFSFAGKFSIILLFSVIAALPQLYYAAEYLSRCYREVGQDGTYIGPLQKVPLRIYMYRYLLNPSDFENFIGQKSVLLNDWNFVYMGILPLCLCIAFLVKGRFLQITEKHTHLKKLLIIILVIGVLSVLGYLTFFPYILYAIPFVNGVRELSRYVILISFSDALLVGMALTYITQIGDQFFQPSSKLNLTIALLLILNVLYWIISQQKDISLDVSIPYLLAFLFLLSLVAVQTTIYTRSFAIAFILIDLFMNPVNYATTQVIFYPAKFYARNKIVDSLETSYGKYRVTFDMETYAMTRRNLGDIYNIQTKFGYGGTVNKSYFDFIKYSEGPEIDDLLNIKYVITDKRLDSNFVFKDSTQNLQLYERKNCYPRCYWKRQLGMSGAGIEAENKGTMRQLAYSDLYQKVEINCITRDTLIFSENYYPGWKCYDNQKEIKVYAASIKNYPPLFRCIPLERGHHVIEFKYNKVFYWF